MTEAAKAPEPSDSGALFAVGVVQLNEWHAIAERPMTRKVVGTEPSIQGAGRG